MNSNFARRFLSLGQVGIRCLVGSLALIACHDHLDSASSSISGTEAHMAGMIMDQAGILLTPVEGGMPAGDLPSAGMSDVNLDPTPSAPTAPVNSCESFGSTTCFSSDECSTDARCQNVGTEELPVVCCIAGARGTLGTGDACSTAEGQLTCASSLCVSAEGADQGWCSGPCLSPDDCPAQLPQCIAIAFSGSDTMWCFPPEQ